MVTKRKSACLATGHHLHNSNQCELWIKRLPETGAWRPWPSYHSCYKQENQFKASLYSLPVHTLMQTAFSMEVSKLQCISVPIYKSSTIITFLLKEINVMFNKEHNPAWAAKAARSLSNTVPQRHCNYSQHEVGTTELARCRLFFYALHNEQVKIVGVCEYSKFQIRIEYTNIWFLFENFQIFKIFLIASEWIPYRLS